MRIEEWIDYGENEEFTKSIGRAIEENYGFDGMVHIAEKLMTKIEKEYISRAWNGIGEWMN